MSKDLEYQQICKTISTIDSGQMQANFLQVNSMVGLLNVELTEHELLNLLHTVAARMRSEERVRALHELEGK